MSGRQSSIVDKALRLVAQGATPYSAAKASGIALSTIYRAIRRQRERAQAPTTRRK
jgi:transposase